MGTVVIFIYMKNPFEGMFGGKPDEEKVMEGTTQEQIDKINQEQLEEDAKNVVVEGEDNNNDRREAA